MRTSRLEPLAVGVGAALWFAGTISATLEFVDEGQIVYPSWRLAHGSVPYVDFHHLYGPSLFVLNGALLRLFGEDLRVVRLTLVVVKAVIAALVYAISRRVAPRLIALLVTAILIAAWGMPLWLCNTPYASYYASALCLAGVLVLAGGESVARAALAGVALGLAATFKQTQGVFACISVGLFALTCPPGGVLGCLASIAAVAVALVYMGARALDRTGLVVAGPFVVTAVALAARAMRQPRVAGHRHVGFLLAVALGATIAVAPYAAFYASRGELGALLGDTVTHLPKLLKWFVPLSTPGPRGRFLAGILLGSFATIAAAVAWCARRRPILGGAAVASAAVTTASVIALERALGGPTGLGRYVARGWSFGDVFLLMPWWPPVVLATAGVALARAPGRLPALLFLYAAGAALQLYPSADAAHGLMLLPALLPVLAYLLARFVRAARDAGNLALRSAAWLLVVGASSLAMTPFVQFRLYAEASTGGVFARATGIEGSGARAHEAADLVRQLSALPDRPTLLIIDDEPLLYFLAGIPSAADHAEFALYLLGADLLSAADARALVPENALLDLLERSSPLVVDYAGSAASARFRAAFPAVDALLGKTYAPLLNAGGYHVLARRDR